MAGEFVLLCCVISFFIGRWSKKSPEKPFVYKTADELLEEEKRDKFF